MRLLDCCTLRLHTFQDDIPPYAILSHTWENDEVSFEDVTEGTGESKAGYRKLEFCAEKARSEGLDFCWVDTCCIDKSNDLELSEALNSMFLWYAESTQCYVYLSDVASNGYSDEEISLHFRKSRWFTRGWTLLELIAPLSVEFYSRNGYYIGNKWSLARQIHEVTLIPINAFQGAPLSDFGVEERLAWTGNRQTTRDEDAAYCLLGIFDVQMPLTYGEGRAKAFKRLKKKILSSTVQLHSSRTHDVYRLLGDCEFRVLILNPGEYMSPLTGYLEEVNLLEPPNYNTVSYTWGQEPAIYRIDIGSEPMFIRPNLFQALQRFRDPKYRTCLWIDSICIDQGDIMERSAQVRQMADIYRNAKNVWIWLGEEDLTSKVAIRLVHEIINYETRGNGPWWDKAWWGYHSFKALDRILGRSWFTRRWVLRPSLNTTRTFANKTAVSASFF